MPPQKSSSLPPVFPLYLLSDSTGETLSALARAACANFTRSKAEIHLYALLRDEADLAPALEKLAQEPGAVMYTILDEKLRRHLEEAAAQLGVPYLAVLDQPVHFLASYLGRPVSLPSAARQHIMDKKYFDRIAALEYALAHDDGERADDLEEADIILVGPSRTSKTPTCIYLAHRGVRAANVPLVAGLALPPSLERVRRPLVIGLTVNPARLARMRRQRFASSEARGEDSAARADSRIGDYAEATQTAREMQAAREIFARNGWPVIDVTHHSVEETAAAALNLARDKDEQGQT